MTNFTFPYYILMQFIYFLLYSWTIILIAWIFTLFSNTSIFPETTFAMIFIALSPIFYLLVKYVKKTSVTKLKLKRLSYYRVLAFMICISFCIWFFQPDFLTLISIGITLATLFFWIDNRFIFILWFLESIWVII